MGKDSVAVGKDGRLLPYTPDQVDAMVRRSLDEGDLLAVISKMPDGTLAVAVLGEPSHELVEILEHTASQYRKALLERGH